MNDTVLEEEVRFETSQNVVAAFFVYNGLEIDELLWANGVCTFFFQNTPELRQLLTDFVSNKARVEPQAFNNAFVEVRSRMFKARDDQ
jgi:hypothetical protein